MKSDKIKKALLVVLVAVALYIWWGNLKLFYAEPEPAEAGLQVHRDGLRPDASSALEYSPPKVNPFSRSIPRRVNDGIPTQNPPAAIVKLSQNYRLVGAVGVGKGSQVIIANPVGGQTVLAVGDTLAAWKLVEIHDNFVVFRQARLHDTLRIGVPGL